MDSKYLKKKFFKLAFVVNTFLKLLLGKKIDTKEYDIFIVSLINLSKSNQVYEIITKKYDNKVHFLQNKTATFLRRGYGAGVIHVYRKVQVDNSIFFEKTYRLNSQDYKRTTYFYRNIYTYLESIVPALEQNIKGQKLAIIYYKFVNLEPIDQKELFDLSIKYYDVYASLKLTKQIHEIDYYHDFSNDGHYLCGKNTIMRSFDNTRLYDEVYGFFHEVEEEIKKTTMLFQHGDLNVVNVCKNNYLIDWDNSGFYPMGYDLGLIFARRIKFLKMQNSIEGINDFIKYHAQEFVSQRNVWLLKYFTIIFLIRFTSKNKNNNNNIQEIFKDLMSSNIKIAD